MQGSTEDLRRCEPQYSEVCDGSREVINEDPSHPATEPLISRLNLVVNRWDCTWNVTHVYFNKLVVDVSAKTIRKLA